MDKVPDKAELLSALAPSTLPETVRSAVLHRLQQLCLPHLLAYQAQGYFANLSADYFQVSELIDTTADTQDISDAFASLKTGKMLTLSFFASALTAPLQENHELDTEKFDQWLALVVLCCCSLQLAGDHNNAIESALREIRLIATDDKHAPVLNLLPSTPQTKSLNELDGELDAARERSSNLAPLLQAGLARVSVVVRSVARNRKGIKRRRIDKPVNDSNNSENQSGQYTAILTVADQDDDPSSITVERLENPFDDAADESAEITPGAVLRVQDSQLRRKELALQALHGKRVTEQMLVRQKSLPASFEQASEWDIEQLIKHAYEAHDADWQAANWLLLSLLTSRDPTWLAKQFISLQIKQKKPLFWLAHQVPAGNQAELLEPVLPKIIEKLHLPLPSHMLNWVLSNPLSNPPPATEELRAWLAKINQLKNTRLTIGRISRYLEHWMLNKGIDQTVISLVRGQSHKERPTLSYMHQSRKNVFQHYCHFVNSIYQTANLNADLPDFRGASTALGSRLHFPEKVLGNFFDLLASPLTDISDPVQFHNHYVIYTWNLLAFSTGHRDVNAPLGLLGDFNPYQKTWWISDKERRHNLAARTLVIPPTAIQQAKLYKKHLKQVARFYRLTAPNIAEHCEEQVLKNNANLLFFLEELDGHLKPIDLTSGQIDSFLGNRLLWAKNWARHHLRTELSLRSINAEVIDGWMGHEELGEEALGPFSMISIYDFQNLANKIEAILIHHQIEALPGWKTR